MTAPNTKHLALDLDLWRDVYLLNEAGRRWIANFTACGHWDDWRFPATAINPPGGASDPQFNTDDMTLDFANNQTDVIGVVVQSLHKSVDGQPLRPHVHWRQTTTGQPYLRLRYKVIEPGAEWPAAWTTLNVIRDGVFPFTSNPIHQITPLGDIPYTGTLSTLYIFEFSRLGNNASDTYDSDWQLSELDVHGVESIGSIREYSNA